MVKCTYCDKDIAPEADDCPNCGAKTETFEMKISIRDWNKAAIINFGATLVLFAVILQSPPPHGMLTISIYFVLCFGFFISSINVNAQLNKQLVKSPEDRGKKIVKPETLKNWAQYLTQGTFSVLTSIIAVSVYLYMKFYVAEPFAAIIPPILLVLIVWISLIGVRSQLGKAAYSWISFPIFILIYILLDAVGLTIIV